MILIYTYNYNYNLKISGYRYDIIYNEPLRFIYCYYNKYPYILF